MNDSTTTIEALKQRMDSFVEQRDWHQFHNPKNLTMALAVETAELMEHFLWVESSNAVKQLEKNRDMVEQEIADIVSYLLAFCSDYNIDITQVFERKMKLNEEKYTVEKCREITKTRTEL